jgi:hypothetical protein
MSPPQPIESSGFVPDAVCGPSERAIARIAESAEDPTSNS